MLRVCRTGLLLSVLVFGSGCEKFLIKGASSGTSASVAAGGASSDGGTSGGGGSVDPTPSPTPSKVLEPFKKQVVRALSVRRVIFPGYKGSLIRVRLEASGKEFELGSDPDGELDIGPIKEAIANGDQILITRIFDQSNVTLDPDFPGDRLVDDAQDGSQPILVMVEGKGAAASFEAGNSLLATTDFLRGKNDLQLYFVGAISEPELEENSSVLGGILKALFPSLKLETPLDVFSFQFQDDGKSLDPSVSFDARVEYSIAGIYQEEVVTIPPDDPAVVTKVEYYLKK